MGMIKEAVRRLKNVEGQRRGYSNCMHCGDSWFWKSEASIHYSECQSMFPICEECFSALSFEEIMLYCLDLWIEWSKFRDSDCKAENFPAIIIAESIEQMKGKVKNGYL